MVCIFVRIYTKNYQKQKKTNKTGLYSENKSQERWQFKNRNASRNVDKSKNLKNENNYRNSICVYFNWMQNSSKQLKINNYEFKKSAHRK